MGPGPCHLGGGASIHLNCDGPGDAWEEAFEFSLRAAPFSKECILDPIVFIYDGVEISPATLSPSRLVQDSMGVGWTLAQRQLLARPTTTAARAPRDLYRALRAAPSELELHLLLWALRVWSLSAVSLRRRGTLLRTTCDQWWHGEKQLVGGSYKRDCPLCQALVCSRAHIICSCPSLDSFRRDQLYSSRGANNRVRRALAAALLC